MKKVFLSLIAITLLTVFAAPVMVLAESEPVDSCTLRHDIELGDKTFYADELIDVDITDAWGMVCMLDAIYTVVDWIFVGLIAIVSLFTILGAFDILTAAGDPEKVKKGRERIMYAMVGLAIALLSRAVPSLVKAVIGT